MVNDFEVGEVYRIAGKFGGNYIWRNGLQAAKNKYWRNLNLAIGNRIYKFLLRHRVFVYGGSPHVVREDRSLEEFQLESYVRGHHIYKTTWTPLLGEVLSAASRPHVRCYAYIAFSRSFVVRVDDSHVIFLGSVGPSNDSCEKNLYKAILS